MRELVDILNAIDRSSDSVFCDIVNASSKAKSCLLYELSRNSWQESKLKYWRFLRCLLIKDKKYACEALS